MDIEAEIVHAKGGMDSYKFRLIVLEKMLAGLKSLGAEHAAASNQSLALAAAKQLTSFSNSVLERQFGEHRPPVLFRRQIASSETRTYP
jgi:hypothetical protein